MITQPIWNLTSIFQFCVNTNLFSSHINQDVNEKKKTKTKKKVKNYEILKQFKITNKIKTQIFNNNNLLF